jgi:hypothetical protein
MLNKKQFNEKYTGHAGKIMDNTQHTVPDQHMSVRELLSNHSRGLPIHAQTNEGQFFGTEIPIITDLTDLPKIREELNEQNKNTTNVANDEIQAAKNKKAAILPPDLKGPEIPTKTLLED